MRGTAEQLRLDEADTGQGRLAALGPVPAASARGAPCAKTTAPTATPGTTSRTTTRAAAPTAGTKTASAGFCDDRQHICLARRALEREGPDSSRSGCSASAIRQGNHGEDVKEYYFFLDGTPTHSYMKMLYKYPQVAYPYDDLVESTASATSRSRSTSCSTRSVTPSLPTATSMCSSSTPRLTPRISSAASRPSTAGPRRRRSTFCPISGIATLGRGRPDGERASDPGDRPRRGPHRRRDRSASAGGTRAPRTASRSICCSPRTRPTSSGSTARPTSRPT